MTVDAFTPYRPMPVGMPLREGLHSDLLGGPAWGESAGSVTQFLTRAAYRGDPASAEEMVITAAVEMILASVGPDRARSSHE
jgi:hypothetical protein